MKTKVLKTILILLVTLLLTSNVSAEISDGLVAYYPFNENANDESGNGNHGTVNGAVLASDIDGNADSAYCFDGDDDYIHVPDSDSLDLTDTLTIAVWIKLDSYAGDSYGGYQPNVITKAYSNFEPYSITLKGEEEQTYLNLASSTSYREWPRSDVGVPVNQWTHVAITFNNGNLNFYHNGILTRSTTSSIQTLYKTTGPLYIGARKPSYNTVDGTLDEIRIYNRALSPSEIREISGFPCFDSDLDDICDDTDNCPNIANPNQEDVDCDGIGDFCDPDTIYGTVSGEMQGDVIVGLYRPSCGVNTLLSTRITDLTGYYAFGNIGNGTYIVAPHHVSYSFVPEQKGTPIPQPEIQSYDFSAMFLLDHDGDGKINYLSGCSNLDGNCDYDDSQYDENIISVIQDDGTIEELRTYADIDFNTVTPVFHPTRDQTFDYCSNLTWSGNSDWESLDEHDAWKLASANYTFDTDCASYGSFGCDIFANSWDPKSTWETPPEPWLSKLNLLSLYNNNWYRNWRLDGCNGRGISESCTSWFTIQESDRYEQNKYETDSRWPDARPMVICKGTM